MKHPILVLACLTLAAPASAQTVATPAEAMARDALEYAARYGVSAIEALRRLRAQEASVIVTDAIAARFRDRLSGLFVEHDPAYRIVVLLTGDGPVADEAILAGDTVVPVVFRTGAPATRARLLDAIGQHQADLAQMLTAPPGLGVDARTGRLAILVRRTEVGPEDAAALAETLTGIAGVPVELRAWDGVDADLSQPVTGAGGAFPDPAIVEGGGRVVGIDPADGRSYACTTGFVVTDGARDGIATAAHCPDQLAYVDPGRGRVPLDYAGQWGARYQDVQVNVAPGSLASLFHADTAAATSRPVTSWRNRAATRVGDFVCHRGGRTGYSCAEVAFVDFAPPGDLCAGPCEPNWVAVRGPGCRGGDSGGPVFVGTTAFGIVKGASYGPGGACELYYYMSVDALPPGWRLRYAGEASSAAAISAGSLARP